MGSSTDTKYFSDAERDVSPDVVFRVIRQVASGRVVDTERRCPLGTATQFMKEISEVNCLLGSLRGRDDFGLA